MYRCNLNAEDKLKEIKGKSLNDIEKNKIVSLFKTIGETTRAEILLLLTIEQELFVCELVDLLKMEQSAVSHQLRVLRNKDLVKARKVGKAVYYSLKDDHVRDLFSIALEHIREEEDEKL